MDKTAIKNFAIEARKILMKSAVKEQVSTGLQRMNASLRSRKELILKCMKRWLVQKTEFMAMIGNVVQIL